MNKESELSCAFQRVLLYNDIREDLVVRTVVELAIELESGRGVEVERREAFRGALSRLAAFAEEKVVRGDVYRRYCAELLLSDENPFSLARERGENIEDTSLRALAMGDMNAAVAIMNADVAGICANLSMGVELLDYIPAGERPVGTGDIVAGARAPGELLERLSAAHRTQGCGLFGRYRVLRFDGEVVSGIDNPDMPDFDDIIGCEEQKRRIIGNTRAFVEGRPANNCLLIGSRGTGKSTCVKALVKLFPEELRLIEVSRENLSCLPEILRITAGRGKRFILFIDDLSFDDFEVEYKHMKSLLEGSVEKRPQNLLFYATSNRRHLIRENWSDKNGTAINNGEVHASDTVNEKLSLSDRFGLTITFTKPSPVEYYRIVDGIARKEGLDLPETELRERANAWELNQKGLSGRTARQLVNHILCDSGGE